MAVCECLCGGVVPCSIGVLVTAQCVCTFCLGYDSVAVLAHMSMLNTHSVVVMVVCVFEFRKSKRR